MLSTDASINGLGAVLFQEDVEDNIRIIMNIIIFIIMPSRTLEGTEV